MSPTGTLDIPTFPVLALSQDGSIVPHESASVLTQCNARAFWKNRYYDDMRAIDADARTWRVRGVRLRSPESKPGKLLARLTNGRLRVEVVWQREPQQDGIEQARITVAEWLSRDASFWEASADIEDWESRVRGCRTMNELLSVFR